MAARVMRSVGLIALTGLILTGCGRQVAKDPFWDPDLLATGPAPGSRLAPRPFVAPSIDAAGGLPAWTQCWRLDLNAIVTANRPDGSAYLTQHQFTVYPWSDAIQVIAGEPLGEIVCRVVGGRYTLEGDQGLDVSPLSDSYRAYAEAVLQIVTAPVRMLQENVVLTRRPIPVQIVGQWYQPIDARYQPRESVLGEKGRARTVLVEPYWTQGTYFQNQDGYVVDIIWLANPIAQKSLLVRGYDYTRIGSDPILIPTKMEIFRSGPNAEFGPRIALIDLLR